MSKVTTDKLSRELLKQIGYILYECTNQSEIEKFRGYYTKEEELCTFDDTRLDECYVFFAVKENIHSIKRENFKVAKK